nr:cation:dicarboxylase symporter family transporter [Luteitalea sp. TBR-22]
MPQALAAGRPRDAETLDARQTRLFARSVIGIGAGILTGLLLGDAVRALEFVSDGFVRLLQVNVLPYLLGSLIASLGMRGSGEIRLVARYGVTFLLFVWGLTLVLVMLCSRALPASGGTPFFGPSATPPAMDWLDLYIPSNLFHALANNLIPAVVLFGVLAGLALGQLHSERKVILLQVLGAFNETMAGVSRMILTLTPYGLFASVAVTAGEFRPDQLLRLHVWLHYYAVGSLLLALWILPALASSFTAVPYGRLLRSMRSAILAAAAAGDVLVVLPLISESAKALLAERGVDAESADGAVSVAVPLLYNFPHAGKVLSLAFLPYAAWFAGSTLTSHQVLLLVSAGPLSLFGSINAAMPFLLDLLHLPADLIGLFTVSGVINSRFGSMAAAAHTACLSLLVSAAVLGRITVAPRTWARYVVITTALITAFIGGTRAGLTWVLPATPGGLQALAPLAVRPPLARIVEPVDDGEPPQAGQRLLEIRTRGVLRVGYFRDALPWAFTNGTGEAVGLDIEAAHRLARELQLSLALVAVERTTAARDLTAGRVDILMSGVTATVPRVLSMELSRPYGAEHLGFLVRDFDRGRFETMDALDRGKGMVIALPPVDGAAAVAKRVAPLATVRTYRLVDQALTEPSVTAVLMPLERAHYWSRVHPELSAVRPPDLTTSTVTVYAMPRGEDDLREVVDVWLDTRRASGDADEAVDYWIRGVAFSSRTPRWSILKDVLGWKGF